MTNITQQFWTYELSGTTLLIDNTFQLTGISLILTGGFGQVIGGLSINGLASTPINLQVGQPITLFGNSGNFLSGLNIDATFGTISILGKQ